MIIVYNIPILSVNIKLWITGLPMNIYNDEQSKAWVLPTINTNLQLKTVSICQEIVKRYEKKYNDIAFSRLKCVLIRNKLFMSL